MPSHPDCPEFYTGAPVDSADLRFRDAFLAELWETLRTRHVLLTAPRRTGKTSVMDHLRDFPKHGFTVIYQNVQDLTHPADFFQAILDTLHDQHPEIVKHLAQGWKLLTDTLNKVTEFGIAGFKIRLRDTDPDWKDHWRQHGDRFLDQVRKQESSILLIVDELPDMLFNLKREHPAVLREFLAWFRAQRQDPHPSKDRARWLIGGSVNLSGTLDGLGLVDLINDLDDVPLPVLADTHVIEFVQSMLARRGVDFEETVPEQLRAHLGRPIPLFMQMATQELYRSWKKAPRKLVSADVDRIFAQLVVSTAAQDKLQHYYSRIAKYYEEPRLSAAHALLGQISLSPADLSRTALTQEFERYLTEAGQTVPAYERKRHFNQLLHDLENDFYISEIAENQYDFASGLLKAWWKKYYA
ncbi:MAG: ATP-binding protein [Candidatus Competibacteraceae bacterium]|nr:ATP-binding protein [Candidatus Competibacteraceae bacterium]MCP5133457.1 ATP-binding protein [Gammaproteobacteria bacterium]